MVSPLRRALLLAGLGVAGGGASTTTHAAGPGSAKPPAGAAAVVPASPPAEGDPVRRGRPLVFPRDHGAHPGSSIEWWYATGWLGEESDPRWGFQVTFFRSRTGLADGNASRFAARQLLFAHAALTDLRAGRHHHLQRIARWSGRDDGGLARASTAQSDVRLGPWRLWREESAGTSVVRSVIASPGSTADFELELTLRRTQRLLLQGDAGFSRKGPQEHQASHYYSEPQMAAQARLRADGRAHEVAGRGWLDHEWSDALMDPQAVGWDWIGMNLFDGTALTAFQLRRADGSVLWAGGSERRPGAASRSFAPGEVRFTALRHWTSPATGTRYPVAWTVETPLGRHEVNALLDTQELDSRASAGTLYWEGVSELRDGAARRVGLGYLELTGYGQKLRL